MAQRREPRRLRQLPRAPHGAVGCCSGKSPAESDSFGAPRTAPVDGAAVRAPQAQAAAARPAWRRSMAQRKSPAYSDSCRAPRTAPVDGAAATALKTQAAEARPARRRSMAQRREPRRLRQLPPALLGAGRWRGGETREPRRHRQLPRAPHGASRWHGGKSPTDSDSYRAPRTAPVDGAAARAPPTQTPAARLRRRRSMVQRPADSDNCSAPRTAPLDAAAARAPLTQTATARPARRQSMVRR